jgi:hypothetical protein
MAAINVLCVARPSVGAAHGREGGRRAVALFDAPTRRARRRRPAGSGTRSGRPWALVGCSRQSDSPGPARPPPW